MDYPTRFNKLLAGHVEFAQMLASRADLASQFSPAVFSCLSDDWGNEIELIIDDEREIVLLVNSPARATKLRFLLPAIKSSIANSLGKNTNILIKISTNQPIDNVRERNNSMRSRSMGSSTSSSLVSEAAGNLENEALSLSLINLAENLAHVTKESDDPFEKARR